MHAILLHRKTYKTHTQYCDKEARMIDCLCVYRNKVRQKKKIKQTKIKKKEKDNCVRY